MDSDAEDPYAGGYNDGNRAFLQSLLARATLTFKEGQTLLAHIFSVQESKTVKPEEVTRDDFNSFIAAAADALSPFDYEIRSTQDQISKERVYCLVNSVSDPFTQMATIRTTEEILYVKRLLDAMFETYNTRRREVMAISSMQALETKIRKGSGNRQSGAGDATQEAVDKGLTSEQTEKLLGNLVNERWIARSKAGFYTLTPRALMELKTWLVDAYNESDDDAEEWQRIKTCVACKDIITIGQRCANLECNIRLHDICESAYWNSRPDKSCPGCETAWTGKNYVGQKAVTTTEEYLRGKRRSGVSQRKETAEAEQETDEDEAETSTVNGSKRNRSKRTRPADEEEEQGTPPPRNRGRPKRAPATPSEQEADEDEGGEGEEEESATPPLLRSLAQQSQRSQRDPSEDEDDEEG